MEISPSLITFLPGFCYSENPAGVDRSAKQDYPRRSNYAMMRDMSQSDSNKTEELYARIRGYVQGIGFRYFVIRKAQALGLRGYTRNKSDGSVEVVAQGSRSALERLLPLLWQGPPEAEVQDVQTIWRAPTEQFSGFHIRY